MTERASRNQPPAPPLRILGHSTMSSGLPHAVNYHKWILGLCEPWLTGDLLEVGFGHGQYTAWFAQKANRVVAIDADARCIKAAPPQPANVELATADLSDPALPDIVGRKTFDAVACLNVLEHIRDDAAALTHLREVLCPGGRLLLFVPAHQALYSAMDRLAGHFRRYGRPALRCALTSAGLQVEALQYFNPVGGVGWWLNAKLASPQDLSDPLVNRQIKWFDRVGVPLSRLLDPLTRSFFGQSLWAVARRQI